MRAVPTLCSLLVLLPPLFAQRAARSSLPGEPPLEAKIFRDGPKPRFLFVDDDATGSETGRNWGSAFTDLSDAFDAARGGTTIFVAGGTYRPDRGTGDPALHFDIPSDVNVLGGYAGSGAPNPFARNPALYPTVLSGDLAGDDGPGFANRADNSIGIAWVGAPTTHREGAIADVVFRGSEGSAAVFSFDPCFLRRCRFEDNRTAFRGAGLYAVNDAFVLECEFVGNRVDVASEFSGNTGGGGGMAVGSTNGGVSVVIRGSRFVGNVVEVTGATGYTKYGGGLLFASSFPALDLLTVVDTEFDSNELRGLGGARGAGIQTSAHTDLIRCDFVGNRIDNGDGVNCLGAGLCSGIGSSFGGASNVTRAVSCRFFGNEIVADLGASTASVIDLRGAGAYIAGGLVQNGLASGNRLVLTNPGGALGRTVVGSGVAAYSLAIRNSTFANNTVTAVGSVGIFGDRSGGGFGHDGPSSVHNTILWRNDTNGTFGETDQLYAYDGASASAHYSCLEGWTGALGGSGNVGSDPLFTDPLGPDAVPGTLDDDLTLAGTSPVADAGDNAATGADPLDLDGDGNTAESLPQDLAAGPRFEDNVAVPDTGLGGAPVVDMGAYEGN